MSIQILRNTRMWISTATGDSPAYTPTNTHEIEIQSDYSFSQDNNSTDITVDEAGERPTRGSERFNDSLNPADWSFTTYLNPYIETGTVQTPDSMLWNALATDEPYDLATDPGASGNATNFLVKFLNNSAHVLGKFDLIFHVDNVWYKITDCQVGTASISVDISDLGKIAWSGQGKLLLPLTSAPFDPATAARGYTPAMLAAPYIENKLTTLVVTDNNASKSYSVPITGATIDINNNVTFLTPDSLSRVDRPVASYTGTFDVSGSLDAYLRTNSTGLGGTAELLADMLDSSEVQNSFTIAICMGGRYTVPSPGVVLVMKSAHLSIPSVSTADVLTTSIDIKAIPTELDTGDEIYLGMSPVYTTALIDDLIELGDADPAP